MNEERLFELLRNPELDDLITGYYRGDTGEFDLGYTYNYTDDYQYTIRYSDNPIVDISAIALTIANNELPNLRRYEELTTLTDEELLTLSALEIARGIQHEENKHMAFVQGDEWRSDKSKVTQYGSRAHAENKGYDQHMNDHIASKYQFLTPILTLLEKQKQEQNQEQSNTK